MITDCFTCLPKNSAAVSRILVSTIDPTWEGDIFSPCQIPFAVCKYYNGASLHIHYLVHLHWLPPKHHHCLLWQCCTSKAFWLSGLPHRQTLYQLNVWLHIKYFVGLWQLASWLACRPSALRLYQRQPLTVSFWNLQSSRWHEHPYPGKDQIWCEREKLFIYAMLIPREKSYLHHSDTGVRRTQVDSNDVICACLLECRRTRREFPDGLRL